MIKSIVRIIPLDLKFIFFQALTRDITFIAQAVQDSDVVQVNPDGVSVSIISHQFLVYYLFK